MKRVVVLSSVLAMPFLFLFAGDSQADTRCGDNGRIESTGGGGGSTDQFSGGAIINPIYGFTGPLKVGLNCAPLHVSETTDFLSCGESEFKGDVYFVNDIIAQNTSVADLTVTGTCTGCGGGGGDTITDYVSSIDGGTFAAAVVFESTLGVEGNTTLEGTTTFGGQILSSKPVLDITANTRIGGTLSVETYIYDSVDDLWLNDNIIVAGTADLQSTIQVQGNADFQTNVYNTGGSFTVNDSLIVENDARLNDTLTVIGVSNMIGNVFNNGGSFTIADTLTTTGDSHLEQTVYVGDALFTGGENELEDSEAGAHLADGTIVGHVPAQSSPHAASLALQEEGFAGDGLTYMDPESFFEILQHPSSNGTRIQTSTGTAGTQSLEFRVSAGVPLTSVNDSTKGVVHWDVLDTGVSLDADEAMMTFSTNNNTRWVMQGDGDFRQVAGTTYPAALNVAAGTTLNTLTVTSTSDLQGNVSDSVGTFTIADDAAVTGAATMQTTLAVQEGIDAQDGISDTTGDLRLADNIVVTGTSDNRGNVFDSGGVYTIDDEVKISDVLTVDTDIKTPTDFNLEMDVDGGTLTITSSEPWGWAKGRIDWDTTVVMVEDSGSGYPRIASSDVLYLGRPSAGLENHQGTYWTNMKDAAKSPSLLIDGNVIFTVGNEAGVHEVDFMSTTNFFFTMSLADEVPMRYGNSIPALDTVLESKILSHDPSYNWKKNMWLFEVESDGSNALHIAHDYDTPNDRRNLKDTPAPQPAIRFNSSTADDGDSDECGDIYHTATAFTIDSHKDIIDIPDLHTYYGQMSQFEAGRTIILEATSWSFVDGFSDNMGGPLTQNQMVHDGSDSITSPPVNSPLLINYSVSGATDGPGLLIHYAISLNRTIASNCKVSRDHSSTSIGNVSGTCIVPAAANSVIRLELLRDTDSGDIDLVIDEASVTVIQL